MVTQYDTLLFNEFEEIVNLTDKRPVQLDTLLGDHLPCVASAMVETGLYGMLLILAPLTLYTLVWRPEQSSFSSSTFMDKIVIGVCGVQLCAATAVRFNFLHIDPA